eukprot:1490773-Pleurochrysis_carterae.AAC.2
MGLQRIRLRGESSEVPCQLLHLTAKHTHPCWARPNSMFRGGFPRHTGSPVHLRQPVELQHLCQIVG